MAAWIPSVLQLIEDPFPFSGRISCRNRPRAGANSVLKQAVELADNINEANWVGEVFMERRFDRTYARFPVDVVWTAKAGGFQMPASVVDICQGGLRLHTGPPLIPGGMVHVFREGRANPFAYCRVVWARTHGGALPSEAGLEILEQLADAPRAA